MSYSNRPQRISGCKNGSLSSVCVGYKGVHCLIEDVYMHFSNHRCVAVTDGEKEGDCVLPNAEALNQQAGR